MVRVRYRSQHTMSLIKRVTLLLVAPVVLAGGSYAIFTQDLSIGANTSSVGYVSNNYTMFTYTKTATFAAGVYTYKINPFVIKNNGVTAITAWQVQFDVPSDTTVITCPTSVTCNLNNTTKVVTITRTVTIAAGATSTINNTANSIRFTTATPNYVLQDVAVSATYSTAYTAIAGLTVVATAGAKSGGMFPLTVTISNNSGQSISGWQVKIPTTKSCTSAGHPAGVTYTCTTTFLTYTGAAIQIANGANYNFTASITTTMTSWNTSGATVTGRA
ncbi:MAG: hypothetical protein KA604_00470 [Candidatus Saccharimonas sp.]|nr:hypothetical protein [Candidatus Saccharimonas sp.]